MLKQTSAPYNGQLLAFYMFELSVEHIGALEYDTNYSSPTAFSFLLMPIALSVTIADDVLY